MVRKSGFQIAAVLLLGAVLLLPGCSKDPTGLATGSITARDRTLQSATWKLMEPHGRTFLKAYSDVLGNPPDDPELLLAAFNELAYAVTGRGGIWRKKVPHDFFGCKANDHLPICRKFVELEPSLGKWDALQQGIGALESEREARRFLRKNHGLMERYMHTFVPRNRSLSAVQATPFFEENLAQALEQ